jgi:hypothetical protein
MSLKDDSDEYVKSHGHDHEKYQVEVDFEMNEEGSKMSFDLLAPDGRRLNHQECLDAISQILDEAVGPYQANPDRLDS